MQELSEIVAAHTEAVWRAAYRLLNDREDALDCYQDTFLAATKLAHHGQVQHWRTVLVRIATRRAIDQLRKRYASKQSPANVEVGAVEPAHEISPAAEIEAAELRQCVRQLLARLPTLQAEAFWLRVVEQLSAAEVAEALEITPGHARVLVHRATVALREQLRPTFGQTSLSEGET